MAFRDVALSAPLRTSLPRMQLPSSESLSFRARYSLQPSATNDPTNFVNFASVRQVGRDPPFPSKTRRGIISRLGSRVGRGLKPGQNSGHGSFLNARLSRLCLASLTPPNFDNADVYVCVCVSFINWTSKERR